MTTPPNSPQSGYTPGPYQPDGQQAGQWPQTGGQYAAPGVQAPGQQAQGQQAYGYGPPQAAQGYAPGYPPQQGSQQGHGLPGQPGYGPQDPGAAGWAPAGGQPHPQGHQPPQGHPPMPDPAQGGEGPGPKSRFAALGKSVGRRIVVGLVGVGVLVGGGYILDQVNGAPSTANVGDCMAGANEKELKVVECTDPSAAWTVVGKLEDKTQVEFNTNLNICRDFPEAGSAYWEGKRGRSGYVLCLKKK